jgi:hypothetical protein
MILRPTPKDIWRIDFGKFMVLLILSLILISLLVWNEAGVASLLP